MAARYKQVHARKDSGTKDGKHKKGGKHKKDGKDKKTRNIAGHMAKQLMKLDANKDGRLNADEVAPRLKSKFSDVDTDGDGYLDGPEIRRQIKKRIKQKQRAESPQEEGESNASVEAKQEGQEA